MLWSGKFGIFFLLFDVIAHILIYILFDITYKCFKFLFWWYAASRIYFRVAVPVFPFGSRATTRRYAKLKNKKLCSKHMYFITLRYRCNQSIFCMYIYKFFPVKNLEKMGLCRNAKFVGIDFQFSDYKKCTKSLLYCLKAISYEIVQKIFS